MANGRACNTDEVLRVNKIVKYRIKDKELFDKAYKYIEQYY